MLGANREVVAGVEPIFFIIASGTRSYASCKVGRGQSPFEIDGVDINSKSWYNQNIETFSGLINSFPGNKLKVLCVWPRYYSKYPPLDLLKLSAYHRLRGDVVELVRPLSVPGFTPDVIYITSLFTYAWEKVKEAAEF